MNKKGSITLSVIIIFMAIIPGLFMVIVGLNNNNSLRRAISATQFAAESITSNVVLYDSETNIAEFDDIYVIKSKTLSIIKGNTGIKDDDYTNSFVSEEPLIEIVLYNEVNSDGLDVNYKDKLFHFDKPGALISVEYKLKPTLFKDTEDRLITVVKQFEINDFDFYYDPVAEGVPVDESLAEIIRNTSCVDRINAIRDWILRMLFG